MITIRFVLSALGWVVLTALLKAIGGWGAILGTITAIMGIYHTFAHFSRHKKAARQSPPQSRSSGE